MFRTLCFVVGVGQESLGCSFSTDTLNCRPLLPQFFFYAARGFVYSAMSTMLTATSLPRHSRTENEPSGSVQNPLLRRRSLAGSASTSTHSESIRPRDDRPGPIARISAIHDAQVLSPTFPSTATTSAISSVSTPSLSVDLPGVLRELSSMRKEMKQAIAHMQAELATIKRGVEFLTELLLTIEKSPFKVKQFIITFFKQMFCALGTP